MKFKPFLAKTLCFSLLAPFMQLAHLSNAHAQGINMVEQNLLNLDATVSAPITPDTAVITMSAERTGADAAVITQDVNTMMADAVRDSKAVASTAGVEIEVATGSFSTYQSYDNKGQPAGWVVRSELILKSKDFVVLSKLAGSLSKRLKISSNGFEVSRALKQSEEGKLMQLGLASFQAKALAASKALGFTGYTIRTVSLQQAVLEGSQPRPMMAMVRMSKTSLDSADVPMEAARTALNLSVIGTVQMK